MHSERSLSQLRVAAATDAEGLFDLARQLATSATPERGAFERVLLAILEDPKQCLLVADVDDALIGYLYGLVHPAFHTNGISPGWRNYLWLLTGVEQVWVAS